MKKETASENEPIPNYVIKPHRFVALFDNKGIQGGYAIGAAIGAMMEVMNLTKDGDRGPGPCHRQRAHAVIDGAVGGENLVMGCFVGNGIQAIEPKPLCSHQEG